MEEEEARRIQKSRVKKQKLLCILRQMPGFFSHFQPDPRKCWALSIRLGSRNLTKSWCNSCQCQKSAFHWRWWGRGQPLFTMIWFLICIHGTLPVIKGTDKIYTSHCLPFVPITFPLSFFFLNSPSFSLTLLILTKFLILSLLHHISPPRLELLEFHCHQQ